ncbi:SixA phosphatase family protein [Shimia aestuarii]|uniref:Phosphohistidine phosphatase n=1 Tax=Shimia aestuarii TaxID=254406 RepID=A0A1I4PVE2_9RHOB|nr:histidine phosphatase family protein [Shimia aestuarii]SFM31791.1 phosphohistidine phosphatase [Shimia aestuarii]
MALKLILTRHAKSSWSMPTLSDHDRPLNKRGRESAKALGDWLRGENMQPDQVLTSSAQRTLETFDLMGFDLAPESFPELYLAEAVTMLHVLKQAKGSKVMMIGHNPGNGEFAQRLAAKLPSHPRFLDYPTGATTVFNFNIDHWQDVAFGTGNVEEFVIPRELVRT